MSIRHRTKRHSRRLRLESLEDRTMLAADLVNGVLSVVGTKGSDSIQVQVATAGAHTGELEVNVNGAQSYFTVAQVNSIHIAGLKGNDTITVNDNVTIGVSINGGKGHDTIKGGGGQDTIHGDAGNDSIQGSAGHDTIYGDQGNDTVLAGAGNDAVFGGSGNDSLWGGGDNDTLWGENGKDTINGETGDDVCHGNNGSDNIHGGAGNDDVYGDNGKDSLWGDDDNDHLDGGNSKDDCHGGNGDDQLKGGSGRDSLDGDDGDDLLDKDQGDDDCTDGVVVDLDGEYRALLTGPNNATGYAEYEVENEGGTVETKFEVEVNGATPNANLNIVVDEVTVGQLSTDGSGHGELKFSTNPDFNEVAFPNGFPALHVGSTIVIDGGVQGTFAVSHHIDD